MAPVIFAIIFGIGWLFAIFIAINDFRILVRGKIDDETNATGIPTDQLTGLAKRPGFVRFVAGLRLAFALLWIAAIPYGLIRAWWG